MATAVAQNSQSAVDEPGEQSSSTTGQIRITLTTRDPSVAVPDVPLYVPLSLKRYGLSEVVNHLLATGMVC